MAARLLVLDIETTPLVAYAWGPKWETSLIEIIEPMRILSYSAKWVGGKQITKGWPDYPKYRKGVRDDAELVRDLWDLVDQADIIIGHNVKQFDLATIHSRFAYYFPEQSPSPTKIIDTKTEAKKHLRLPSHKLDDIGDYFNLGRKQEHEGFALWKKCMAGDLNAWKRMLNYNKQDVLLTEKLYLLLRPRMSNHPNLSMYAQNVSCSRCGSEKIQSRGFSVNRSSRYRRFQCQDCSGWMSINQNVSEVKRPYVSI